jgi:hypothetical protein
MGERGMGGRGMGDGEWGTENGGRRMGDGEWGNGVARGGEGGNGRRGGDGGSLPDSINHNFVVCTTSTFRYST